MTSLSLLYIPLTPAPQRHPLLRGSYEIDCERAGAGWKLWAPGSFTCRGEVFVPEPAFVDDWLRGALEPFGRKEGDGYHCLETDKQFRTFVTSLEPVLRARCKWPWAPPAQSDDVLTHADLSRMVVVFPGDPLLRLERARLAVRIGRPQEECNADVVAALALREDAETLLAACYVPGESGDRAGQLAMLARAVARDPTHEQAATQFMLLLRVAERFEEALAVDEARAAKGGRDEGQWYLRAGMLEKVGRLDAAVDALAASLALRDNALLRAHRGTLLAGLGRDDEALRELDAALPMCADFDGHLARADVLIRRGDTDRATKALKWLALAPSHREVAEERLRRLPSSQVV